MRYVSIDIETTGLNPDWCDIIEFGAIIEDTQSQKSYCQAPKFHRYLKPPRPEGYRGETYAINMHGKTGIWKAILKAEENDSPALIAPRRLLHEFTQFLVTHGYENLGGYGEQPKVDLGNVTVAGKCFFAFDWNFLRPLFGERICRRSIDPAVWYWNPVEDEKLPSTPVCLERAGLTATDAHTSLGDAWDVIRLTRKAVNLGLTVPRLTVPQWSEEFM